MSWSLLAPGEQVVVLLYFAVLAALSVFALHRLYLVGLYLRHRHRRPPALAAMEEWPTVTVQLPIYNEIYVVRRLLDAVARLDYPRDRLHVQVLDDSTDGTQQVVAREVARLRAGGLDIVQLRRGSRRGYKAGALAFGLRRARGEYICILDADFVPPPDLLRRTLPHFRDPAVGMVQVRWEHLNRDYSLLTRVQAMLLDAHFAIEHAGRNWSGRFFNFNGTAGVWRRRAIEDAGGWQADTLTEDLDLSYRAQLRGWRFVYLNEPAAPAELPVAMGAFRRQQQRWTRGSVQTARKLLGPIWASGLPLPVRLEATFHLAANLAYPLMVLLAVLVFPAMLARQGAGMRQVLLLDLPVLAAATGSIAVFYLVAARELGRPWLQSLAVLPALMALGMGIALGNALALAEGLRRETGEFLRTPKYSVVGRGGSWRRKSYRARASRLSWVELAVGLYFTFAVAAAVQLGMWPSLPFLVLFQSGYLYTAVTSLAQGSAVPVPASVGRRWADLRA